MATMSSQRAMWAARLGAVLVVAVALAGCADDEPSAAPSDASPTSEQTATAGTDQIDRDESDDDEGTAEASGETEATSDSTDESSDSIADQSTSEQNETDDGSTITTTPPATAATGDEPTTEIDDTVAPVAVPVPGPTVASELEEEADFGTGVSASIVEVEAVEVEGRLPGERSGPGVVVTVEVTNASSEPISLDLVIVDLIGGDGASALPIRATSAKPLTGELEPGQSGIGQYQFFIPTDQRQSATVAISYSADQPTVLFTGALPNA